MRFPLLVVGWVLLTPALAGAQQFDRLVRGQPVADPEAITGRWVAPDGRGGWLEIAVEISARVPVDGSLVRGPLLLAGASRGMPRAKPADAGRPVQLLQRRPERSCTDWT